MSADGVVEVEVVDFYAVEGDPHIGRVGCVLWKGAGEETASCTCHRAFDRGAVDGDDECFTGSIGRWGEEREVDVLLSCVAGGDGASQVGGDDEQVGEHFRFCSRPASTARDGDVTRLQRLAQGLQGHARKFGQLVKKQHAVVRASTRLHPTPAGAWLGESGESEQ